MKQEIVAEWQCPNCKKIIQRIRIRREYIKRKTTKNRKGERYKAVHGSYKLIIKKGEI